MILITGIAIPNEFYNSEFNQSKIGAILCVPIDSFFVQWKS